MEAVSAGDSVRGVTRAKLLREPLFWGAVAAFSGTALGLFGTVRQATLGYSFYVDPVSQLLAQIPGFVGEALVMSSLLGAVYLAWNVLRGTGRRLTLLGMALLMLLLMAEAVGVAVSIYWSTGERWQGYAALPFPALEAAASYAIFFLPPVVLLTFTALILLAQEKSLGGCSLSCSSSRCPTGCYGSSSFRRIPPSISSRPPSLWPLSSAGTRWA